MRALLPLLILAACGGPSTTPASVTWPGDPAALRYAAHGHEIVQVADTLYAFGGFQGDPRLEARGTTLVRSLRLPDGAWQDAAPMPQGRAFFGAARIGGDIYLVGDGIDRYRSADGSWQRWPLAGQVPTSHHGAVAFRGRVYILGGYPRSASRFQVFDPASGQLRTLEPPPDFEPTDHLHVMAVLGDRLHVVGGIRGGPGGLRRTHHAFDGERWTQRADAPHPVWRKFSASASTAHALYVLGRDRGLVYSSHDDRWRTRAAMPHMLVMPAAIATPEAVYVVGGRVVRGKGYGALRYDIKLDAWTGTP